MSVTSAVVKSGSENVVIGPDAVLDSSPASVVFEDGSYAVIWFRGDLNLINELQYQRFDASGNQIGAPISLEHGTSGFSFINATLLPNGNVAIAYQDNYGSLADVKLTIVSQSGAIVNGPQALATTTAGEQSDVYLTVMKINGVDQILATWEDWKGLDSSTSSTPGADSAIRARFLNLDGSASTVNATDFQVNTIDINVLTGSMQLNADVAASPNGGGVIVWTDEANADGYTAIKFKVIAADGTLSAEQEVANQTYHQEHATVAYLPDGKFVVVYAYNTVDSPAHAVEIRTKIFNANGSVSSNSKAATDNVGHKVHPNIEILQDGGFLITWTEAVDGGSDRVYARACDSDGDPIGAALLVSTSPVGDEYESETVLLADGRVLVLYGETGAKDINAQIVDARDLTVQTALNTYVAPSHIDNIVFTGAGNFNGTGNARSNEITGGEGNDTLNGGAGADTLHGGLGNDTYVIDNVGDSVVEALNAGTDTVQSSVSYVLSDNVETLTLTGAAAINGTGNALNNTINGNSAANTIDGGGGVDAMRGGLGDDTYIVNSMNDVVTENTNGGTDLVQAYSNYTLSANVENLTLIGASNTTGAGNAMNNIIRGNTGNNTLYGHDGVDSLIGNNGNDALEGGAGGDFLDGGAGVDTMRGGLGNDTYVVNVMADIVQENANSGTDVVQAYSSFTLGVNVENLTLMGTANINGSGNTLGNVIRGNSGNNSLYGNAGNDTLIAGAGNDKLFGGAGSDYLHGGAGQDAFVLNTAIGVGQSDNIADFNVADDTFWLENSIFAKLTVTGTLSATNFVVGAAAADSNDYVIYNKSTGALFYDSNGNGAGGTVQIATLSANLTLTHQDFLVT